MKRNYLLILLCILVTILVWNIDDLEIVEQYLMFSGDSFFQGRVWTPITALFIHGDLIHLLGNMFFLYVFGSTLEDVVGAKKTTAAFLFGGFFSFLLSLLFYSWDIPMIGASAAIFTLAAVVVATDWSEARAAPLSETATAIGEALLNKYVLPFEIASVLLLAAMVGAIVLVREDR